MRSNSCFDIKKNSDFCEKKKINLRLFKGKISRNYKKLKFNLCNSYKEKENVITDFLLIDAISFRQHLQLLENSRRLQSTNYVQTKSMRYYLFISI